jgi:hypothetical protein
VALYLEVITADFLEEDFNFEFESEALNKLLAGQAGVRPVLNSGGVLQSEERATTVFLFHFCCPSSRHDFL